MSNCESDPISLTPATLFHIALRRNTERPFSALEMPNYHSRRRSLCHAATYIFVNLPCKLKFYFWGRCCRHFHTQGHLWCLITVRWILTLYGRNSWLHGDRARKKKNLVITYKHLALIYLTYYQKKRGLKWTLVVVSYFRVSDLKFLG